jgi:ornithine cyclodeaminase/alanine dehydrogenase-like protein (mu-crystallin family)
LWIVCCSARADAAKEAGDIVQLLKSGVLKKESSHGDLFESARAKLNAAPKTCRLFKPSGTAIEDLAAAMLGWGGLS